MRLSRKSSRRTTGFGTPARWRNSKGPSSSWPGSDVRSPERELDVRSGITSPQSPHREAEDRGGADHGLRGRDGPGDTMLQLQRPGTHLQKQPAETEVPQMRQGGSQDQRMQSREIGMRELEADRAQSLR
jgi:hypothetical protein